MEARRNRTHDNHDHDSHEAPDERRGSQLRLLSGDDRSDMPAPWRLDPVTRERGLVGVRRAREALESTHPPEQRLRRAS